MDETETSDAMVAALRYAGISEHRHAERLTLTQRDAILRVAGWGGTEDAAWALALGALDRLAHA